MMFFFLLKVFYLVQSSFTWPRLHCKQLSPCAHFPVFLLRYSPFITLELCNLAKKTSKLENNLYKASHLRNKAVKLNAYICVRGKL